MVSLITVKRAYTELEREGIIFRKQGLKDVCVGRRRGAQPRGEAGPDGGVVARGLREAREAGLSEAEVLAMVRELAERSRTWKTRR